MLALTVHINSVETTYLIDSEAKHNLIFEELLDTATSWTLRDEPLEVVLANGKNSNTERVCGVPVNLGQGVCHVIKCQVM